MESCHIDQRQGHSRFSVIVFSSSFQSYQPSIKADRQPAIRPDMKNALYDTNLPACEKAAFSNAPTYQSTTNHIHSLSPRKQKIAFLSSSFPSPHTQTILLSLSVSHAKKAINLALSMLVSTPFHLGIETHFQIMISALKRRYDTVMTFPFALSPCILKLQKTYKENGLIRKRQKDMQNRKSKRRRKKSQSGCRQV